MSRELANILRIEDLKPIVGKDRIELATIGGWEVIVQKGEHKIGDLVVYCEYDTVLPVKPEFEFLRSRCYSKRYNGFRIRNMSMAGVFSQGIVFPLSILPEGTKIEEGRCVAKELDIRKYDPEELMDVPGSKKKYGKVVNFLLKFKIFRLLILGKKKPKYAYPETVPKSDETNIQKVFNGLKANYPNELYYKTEKVEGQAGTFLLIGKGRKPEYRFFSHNAIRFKNDMSNWDMVSKKYDLETILRDYFKDTGEKISIQGEIAGPGIQKNIYGFDSLKFFVYGIIDVTTGRKWNWMDITGFCGRFGLTTVPELDYYTTLPDTLKEVLDDSNGESVLANGVRREGIVWRSLSNQNIGFKAKSPEYLTWWDKKDTTE